MIQTNFLYGALRAALVLAGGLCGVASLNALAQVPVEPPQSAAPLPPEAAPLEEEKIDQFADAYLVIAEIHSQAVAELETAESPAAAEQIKTKAEGQIIEAVERSGLRLDEFNQIAELMTLDSALRAKIAGKVQERRRI